jgi:DNA-binding XRE family transcriptional regulator
MHPYELTTWRKSHGFTQTELGEILGVKKTTVYRWEKNMRIIPPFLHLALKCIEKKGDDFRDKGMKTKKERKVNK